MMKFSSSGRRKAFDDILKSLSAEDQARFQTSCEAMGDTKLNTFLFHMQTIVSKKIEIPLNTLLLLQKLPEQEMTQYLSFIQRLQQFNPKLQTALINELVADGKLMPIEKFRQEVSYATNMLDQIYGLKEEELEGYFKRPTKLTAADATKIKRERIITQFIAHGYIDLRADYPASRWMDRFKANFGATPPQANQKKSHETTQAQVTRVMIAAREIHLASQDPYTSPRAHPQSTNDFRLKIDDQRKNYMSVSTLFKSKERKETARKLFDELDADKYEGLKTMPREQYYNYAFTKIFEAQRRIMDQDLTASKSFFHRSNPHSRLFDISNEMFTQLATAYLNDPSIPDKSPLIAQIEQQMKASIDILIPALPGDDLGEELIFFDNKNLEEKTKILTDLKDRVDPKFHYVVDNMLSYVQLQEAIDQPNNDDRTSAHI